MWGKSCNEIDYVFCHPYSWLFYYHYLVINELEKRNCDIKYDWHIENYRGPQLLYIDPKDPFVDDDFGSYFPLTKHKFDWWWNSSLLSKIPTIVYPEHNDEYLIKCLEDLTDMNVELINDMTVNQLKLKLAIKGI